MIIRRLGMKTEPLVSGETGFTVALASYPAVAHVPLQIVLGWLVLQPENPTINSLSCSHSNTICSIYKPPGDNKLQVVCDGLQEGSLAANTRGNRTFGSLLRSDLHWNMRIVICHGQKCVFYSKCLLDNRGKRSLRENVQTR